MRCSVLMLTWLSAETPTAPKGSVVERTSTSLVAR
jgi:hypothetical protein